MSDSPPKRSRISSPERRAHHANLERLRYSRMTDEEKNAKIRQNTRHRASVRTTDDGRKEYNASQMEIRRRRSEAVALTSRNAGRLCTNRPVLLQLGPMTAKCQHCHALHFLQEKNTRNRFHNCCNNESITIFPLQPYPEPLLSLTRGQDERSKNFRNNIRQYNSAVAFASFGCQPVSFSRGPQTFVIHGQVYHKTSANAAPSTNQPAYSQLYILDPSYANDIRMRNKHNSDCRADIMQAIDVLLRTINPFAAAFKMMREVLTENPGKDIRMWITKDTTHDPRTYNLPTANEVAAVFEAEDGEPPFNRDICIHPRKGDALQNISILSPNCDPMTYPLLLPYGEEGWKAGLRKPNGQKITQQDFYSYRLQERENVFNPLLHSAKLTQQYMVDVFLKVEASRLQWIKFNQKSLRMEMYLGLMDHINNQASEQHLKVGTVCVLPSSFTGSKRALQQNYQDAMAMVAKFGKPDLFITFTCNPNWSEIKDNLSNCETSLDRPDLVSTVFNLKLKEFLKDLTKHHVLGKVTAYMMVIEFQKRGLPHAHMLFILDNEDKIKEEDEIDAVVCAEIPGDDDPHLKEIVSACMIHGPCGDLNPKAPCMDERNGTIQCTKGFPKEFKAHTKSNNDGYPEYRRRDNGVHARKGEVTLDNRWVVPYNPYLSRKYNAHMNVEICSTVKSVKYIFKYIYKGHDSAVVRISGGEETYNWDEVQTFLDTRYISAPEAMWRLREYDMQLKSHAVIRLAIHLPSQQIVVFEEGSEREALEKAEKKGTTLTAWFKLNDESPDAHEQLYIDIPYQYVFERKTSTWKRRQRGELNILPRMHAVSPKNMELFSLRLLLLHIPGASSFEDLRTINGTIHQTFKEAAMTLGLLENDTEWERTMEEAAAYQMPGQLRMLFCTILVSCDPSDPRQLYERFKDDMSEDFSRDHPQEIALQLALIEIEEHLCQFGKNCQEFGLPERNSDVILPSENTDLEMEKTEGQSLVSAFNVEQKLAFETIIDSVKGRKQQKCFFLSGAGGCGKTYVYKALISTLRGEGQRVKVVAPTGLAATLLKGGQTVHTGFGIPINLNKDTYSRIKPGTPQWKDLLETKLIIWDEISMCHVDLLCCVDRSLRDLRNCHEPFGGITLVVGGDFRQQAPVVVRGNRVRIVESCVKSARNLWGNFRELKLTQNMRVNQNEVEFSEWLLKVGMGVNDIGEHCDYVKLPPSMIVDDIVKQVFTENINTFSPADLASRAVLCPKNHDTLLINNQILGMLNGEARKYYSVDDVECDSEEERQNYPMEFLNSLTPMGLPPHILTLKVGCCVMLLRNLNPKNGLCNGTRLIVERLGATVVECRIFGGVRDGARVFIPRIRLDTEQNLPFKLKRKQFPLRLAYSMTITKSQGQTYDKIGLYLPAPVFTHGQLYTALSRVRSKEGLHVQYSPGSKQGKIFPLDDSVFIYNCIYREIL